VDIRIDTLRLQASGMDPDTARRFARLVAEGLGAALATWPAAPGAGLPRGEPAGPARFGGLRVAVGPNAGESPDGQAARVAAEISLGLRSASAAGPGPARAGRQ
jgi:hypothetical protein